MSSSAQPYLEENEIVDDLKARLHALADRQRRERDDVMYLGEHDPEISEAADRIEKLEAERQDIAYHAEQMWTYLAQPTISEKDLANARWHNNKVRATVSDNTGYDY